ncbi:MAG: DUF2478 domain-containing protein [Rhodobacteraceae bacterium]|nr:DUF2478 domain-containing protein [Paracoccaceae bacterium]MCF8521105.1 DUF2478 domain-containing protein [Paracoccaceae bacterium]
MQIGFVSGDTRVATDRVLAHVVDLLAARGVRLAGAVQLNTEHPDRDDCDMDVQVLPDGPQFRISQDLGPLAEGCRLDPDALERAVMAVLLPLDRAAVLVINKFGKQEAEGRGFCTLIAEALSRDMTVLLGVSDGHRAAFDAFVAGMADPVGCDPVAIADWVLSQRQAA